MTTTDTPLPLAYSIPSGKRTKLLRDLRPGDWLRGPTGMMFCVYSHKAKKQEVALWQGNKPAFSFTYAEILSLDYVGRGKPRLWLGRLPEWVVGNRCLFSQP